MQNTQEKSIKSSIMECKHTVRKFGLMPLGSRWLQRPPLFHSAPSSGIRWSALNDGVTCYYSRPRALGLPRLWSLAAWHVISGPSWPESFRESMSVSAPSVTTHLAASPHPLLESTNSTSNWPSPAESAFYQPACKYVKQVRCHTFHAPPDRETRATMDGQL